MFPSPSAADTVLPPLSDSESVLQSPIASRAASRQSDIIEVTEEAAIEVAKRDGAADTQASLPQAPTTAKVTGNRRADLRGGEQPPDAGWYEKSAATDNWAKKDLVVGFNLTWGDYFDADERLQQLIGDAGLYTLDWGPKSTQWKVNPIMDKFEKEFKWLTDYKIPRAWRLPAFRGWVRNKMAEIWADPTILDPPDLKTPRRGDRITTAVDPIKAPTPKKRKNAKPKLSLFQSSLLITPNDESQSEFAIKPNSMIKDKQPRIGADGDLNVRQLNFEKPMAELKAQLQFDLETQSIVYSV